MKPRRFRPWAEEQIRKSPAVASVEAIPDDRPGHDYLIYTHVTFTTGAKVIIHMVGTSPSVGGGAVGEDDATVTGPAPEPVKVPELATSGRLKTRDIEQHLAALLNNAGSDEIRDVAGYSQHPQLGSDQQPYGIRIRFHDESAVYALFWKMAPAGGQPGGEFQQREEV